MIWFKSCTRCRGDLFGGADQHEPFVVACLQCGRYLSETEVHALNPSRSAGGDVGEQMSDSNVGHPADVGREPVRALTDRA